MLYLLIVYKNNFMPIYSFKSTLTCTVFIQIKILKQISELIVEMGIRRIQPVFETKKYFKKS